ncbi:MAG: thioredoxin domain-containing protein [Spirochaetales bacterium]|nr:thioredoxin domain-containing protein [Spirochaetales bacterium]
MTKPNRLANEKSLYLQQHKNNPVDWYPWGSEAFAFARQADKPIFLSIGYSACHWCHVMEKESFDDDQVAKLLNDGFVCIKVDREERPDIDQIYMAVTQVFTGQGGWPMTIFMSPDQEPFAAGTYFPKTSRGGRPGLLEILPRVIDLWSSRREALLKDAKRVVENLTNKVEPEHEIDPELAKKAQEYFEYSYDSVNGGFGSAPKFPSPHNLIFLLDRWYSSGRPPEILSMVTHTLVSMRKGGMYDQFGFGFHRYSTDALWRVPHFEKMLYDQAMHILAYTEAYGATGDSFFSRVVEEIVHYCKTEMRSAHGPFFAAQDADSEGEEGLYYVWTADEVRRALAAFPKNEVHEIIRSFNLDSGAQENGIPFGGEPLSIESSLRRALIDFRSHRVHPLTDDKILADWNGLFIAALARAGAVFENDDYLHLAKEAWNGLQDLLVVSTGSSVGRLKRRWREGEAAFEGLLDDYGFILFGLLELYQASFSAEYLKQCLVFADLLIELFLDLEGGGFFTTPKDGEKLIYRPKEAYDGAFPSGNSVAFVSLLRLAQLTGREEYRKAVENVPQVFSKDLHNSPGGFTFLLQGMKWLNNEGWEAVVVGAKDAPQVQEFFRILRHSRVPIVLVHRDPGQPQDSFLQEVFPYLESMGLVNEKPAVYLCRNFTCQVPVTASQELRLRLETL